MEDLTIELCNNNIYTCLTNMQEMQNKIDFLQKEGINYDKHWFLTLTFKDLGKKARDFLAEIKLQHSKWVENPSAFNTSTFISNMINLCTN